MPREMIGNLDGSPWHVTVGWAADRGDFQVGVVARGDDDPSLLRALLGQDETLATIGEAFRCAGFDVEHPTHNSRDTGAAVLDILERSATGGFHGLFSTLDRGDTNRLIRALRKARDAAFGRDE